MSWFSKRKNQPVIPPVQEPPSLGSVSSSRPPSYRSDYSGAANGVDDYSNRRTYADSHPSTFRQNSGGNDVPHTDSYRSRMGYGGASQVTDPYARGERDINADRDALFAGSAPPAENGGGPGRFNDGPEGRPAPTPGFEEEEDVEGIKAQTRFLKQDTVAQTRNALRLAREAEETGRATLLKLGDQSERIANTERHLDVSKGHSVRADDNTDEIKKLNRSIFIPAITFNKDQKRRAQELKREMRYQEEMTERERAMQDIRDSHNRVGGFARGSGYGDEDDEEGIGGRRQKTATELNMRKEQRKRYQFEATASDDEMEEEIDDNLDELLDATKRMKSLGLAMGSELESQNERLERVTGKADKLTMRIDANTSKMKRIR